MRDATISRNVAASVIRDKIGGLRNAGFVGSIHAEIIESCARAVEQVPPCELLSPMNLEGMKLHINPEEKGKDPRAEGWNAAIDYIRSHSAIIIPAEKLNADKEVVLRSDVLDEFEWLLKVSGPNAEICVEEVVRRIKAREAVDVEYITHAHWKYSEIMYDPVYICSNCGLEIEARIFSQIPTVGCPKCRALMDEKAVKKK